MESAKSTKSTKDKILLSLGYAKWIPRVVLVPTLFYKKITILYETVFKDATTITAFTSFIFQFGVELFWKLKTKYGVNSFVEFLRIREFLFQHLVEIMRLYYKEEMLTTIEAVQGSRDIMRLYRKQDRVDFFEFIRKHRKKVLNGRIVLNRKDIHILNRVYRRIKMRYEPNKLPSRNKKRIKNNSES